MIFLDDRREQVIDVGQAVKSLGIQFVGIRFGKSDGRVKSFDPRIVEVQWAHLPKLLSDPEAKNYLEGVNTFLSGGL